MATVTIHNALDPLRAEIEPLLAILFASSAALGTLSLSSLCAHVLVECVRYMPIKKSQRDVLSTSTVFLVTLLMARKLAQAGPKTKAGLMEDDFERLRAWGTIVRDKHSKDLDKLAASFFSEVPTPDPTEFSEVVPAEQFSGVHLGEGLERTLQAQLQEIRITDIVLRSIDDPSTGVAKRMAQHGGSDLVEDLRRALKIEAGCIPEMVREAADDELALDVADYAKALATILRTAKDEFTFALFGPWGSGKTTLTRLLRPLLEDPEAFRKETMVQETLFSQRRYKVVLHNAWKYREPPESWIYLYKSLADCAGESLGAVGRVALAARAAHYRWGPLAPRRHIAFTGFVGRSTRRHAAIGRDPWVSHRCCRPSTHDCHFAEGSNKNPSTIREKCPAELIAR